jgi:hypothetical protein
MPTTVVPLKVQRILAKVNLNTLGTFFELEGCLVVLRPEKFNGND